MKSKSDEKTIKKIVLTGGPCAGKTTALVKITEHFSNLGFKVFTIPEVPTVFLHAGMDYLTKNKGLFYEGEKATLEIQLAMEDKFTKMAAECEEPTVIVCDRGAMDISAYMTPEMWADITSAAGTSTEELLGNRYDAVLHLVSAANGAEEFYNTTSNVVRTEGIDLARQLDRKVIDAWTGHSHLRVINNHQNFEHKLQHVLKEIADVLELPQPMIEERKYIVDAEEIPEGSIRSEIVQTYLTAEPGTEIRLRCRTCNGNNVFVHTTTRLTADHQCIMTERQISKHLYESMLKQADPYRHTIRKTRDSFIWKGQFFQLDTYHDRLEGLIILETKGIADDEKVLFPPFIHTKEDITANTNYRNYALALK